MDADGNLNLTVPVPLPGTLSLLIGSKLVLRAIRICNCFAPYLKQLGKLSN